MRQHLRIAGDMHLVVAAGPVAGMAAQRQADMIAAVPFQGAACGDGAGNGLAALRVVEELQKFLLRPASASRILKDDLRTVYDVNHFYRSHVLTFVIRF